MNRASAVQNKEVKETDANMEEMWTVLKRVKEADLLELCVNHTSFAQTVENIFALSFLVRILALVTSTVCSQDGI